MVINQILATFFPAVISIKMYEKMDKEINCAKMIQRYLRAVLVINIIVYFVLIYLVKQSEFIFTNLFTLKYLVLASVIGVIYSVVEKCIKSNMKCEVEVENSDDKEN